MSRLSIRVQPGARRERLVGWMADGTLKVAVTAPPEAGRANEALTRLLGRVLGVAPADVTVARGQGSRSKVVDVRGLDAVDVKHRLEDALRHGD